MVETTEETAPLAKSESAAEQQELLNAQESVGLNTEGNDLLSPPRNGHGNSNEHGNGSNVESPERAKANRREAPLWTWRSIRFRIAFMLAAALSIEGFMRSNINMAIVCMVNHTAVDMLEGTHLKLGHKAPCHFSEFGDSVEDVGIQRTPDALLEGGNVVLSKREQSMILSAFYVGGLIAALPSGYLCDKYGPRNVVFYGALMNVFGTILTPFLALNTNAFVIAAVRFLIGCGQVVLVPCMNVLIARWFPLSEKSTAIAIATTGNQISVIVALFLTAELCQLRWLLDGWPLAFYVYAILGIFLCIYWMIYVRDYPSQVKHIRSEEIRHIEDFEHKSKFTDKKETTPWRLLFSSKVIWAIACSSFSQNFMNVGTVVYLPAYYQTVLGMKLSKNGVMSALPFVVQLITKGVFAGMADCLKNRRILSHTSTTKLFNMIASVGSGVCYIALAFCDCNSSNLAILLAVSAVGLSSGFIPGYNTSIVCVAPRYTSGVASFSRFVGQVASVVAPYMIGSIVIKGTKEEWQIAFFIMAFVLISTGIVFQLTGSANIQDWARPSNTPPPLNTETPLAITEST